MSDLRNKEMKENKFSERTKVTSEVDKIMVTETTEVKYREAYEKRQFLMEGESIRENLTADWAHFDFALSYFKKYYNPNMSYLQVLMCFWSEIWRYLKPLMESYELLSQQFEVALKEADTVLHVHSNDIIQLRLYKKWIRENLRSKSSKLKFQKWMDTELDKFEADKEEIRNTERERDLDSRLN